jgi:hypothetical protein
VTTLLLDVNNALAIQCAGGGPGAYGAASVRKIQPGAYRVQCDADCVVRDTPSEELRLGDGGNKLEVTVFAENPADVWITGGDVVVAARAAAAVVWLIPLVSYEEKRAAARQC